MQTSKRKLTRILADYNWGDWGVNTSNNFWPRKTKHCESRSRSEHQLRIQLLEFNVTQHQVKKGDATLLFASTSLSQGTRSFKPRTGNTTAQQSKRNMASPASPSQPMLHQWHPHDVTFQTPNSSQPIGDDPLWHMAYCMNKQFGPHLIWLQTAY